MQNLQTVAMPHGPWLIYEPYAREQWELLSRVTPETHAPEKAAHVARMRSAAGEMKAARGEEKPYEVSDGIAIFDLTGPMTKNGSSWSGYVGSSRLRKRIEQAANDPDVKGGFLRVDSPGGSVAGTDDLARAWANFCKKKPGYCYIEDMAASAAMWVSLQSTKVYANPTALVGSFGTFAVVYDMSRAAEQEGIKVHVLSTGKYKGAGTPGSVVTDEQLAQFQSNIDDFNEDFITAVARGRSMPKAKVRELFDGSAYKAPKGLANGILDGIAKSEKEALGALREVAFARAQEHLDSRCEFENVMESVYPDGFEGDVYMFGLNDGKGGIRKPHLTKTEAQNAESLQPISGEPEPPAGSTLAEDTDALLADVRGVILKTENLKTRLEGLKGARMEEKRDLGPKAISHIDATCQELARLQAELEGLKPLTKDERDDARAQLARELLAAELSRAS